MPFGVFLQNGVNVLHPLPFSCLSFILEETSVSGPKTQWALLRSSLVRILPFYHLTWAGGGGGQSVSGFQVQIRLVGLDPVG